MGHTAVVLCVFVIGHAVCILYMWNVYLFWVHVHLVNVCLHLVITCASGMCVFVFGAHACLSLNRTRYQLLCCRAWNERHSSCSLLAKWKAPQVSNDCTSLRMSEPEGPQAMDASLLLNSPASVLEAGHTGIIWSTHPPTHTHTCDTPVGDPNCWSLG